MYLKGVILFEDDINILRIGLLELIVSLIIQATSKEEFHFDIQIKKLIVSSDTASIFEQGLSQMATGNIVFLK